MFKKLYSEVIVGGSRLELKSFDNDCFSFKLDETEDSIKGVFTAKKDMTMSKLIIKGDRDFDDDDLLSGKRIYDISDEARKNIEELKKQMQSDGLTPKKEEKL